MSGLRPNVDINERTKTPPLKLTGKFKGLMTKRHRSANGPTLNVPFSAQEIPFKLDSLALKTVLYSQRIAAVTWFKVASETTGEI